MKSTGEKTVSLPHGQLKFRLGRDKVEVVDFYKFLPMGQRLGLLRHISERYEPDLIAIAAYTKLNGKPPSGVMLTPAQTKFSYKTKGTNDVTDERNNDEQAQAGSAVGYSNKAYAA